MLWQQLEFNCQSTVAPPPPPLLSLLLAPLQQKVPANNPLFHQFQKMFWLERIILRGMVHRHLVHQRLIFEQFLAPLPPVYRVRLSAMLRDTCENVILRMNTVAYCRRMEQDRRRWGNRVDMLFLICGGLILLSFILLFLYFCVLLAEKNLHNKGSRAVAE
jgi:hypothetical protein